MKSKPWPPRFCAACGARLRSFGQAGHARWRCARCGFIVYGNPVLAVVAVMTRGDRILLTRRAHPPFAGTWDLPGGFAEADEEAADAVDRELREELGVVSVDAARAARVLPVSAGYAPGKDAATAGS